MLDHVAATELFRTLVRHGGWRRLAHGLLPPLRQLSLLARVVGFSTSQRTTRRITGNKDGNLDTIVQCLAAHRGTS